MIRQKSKNYFYDREHDSLVIFVKNLSNLSSIEKFSGIYFVINENNQLSSVEILDYSKRNINNLKKIIPIRFNYKDIKQL